MRIEGDYFPQRNEEMLEASRKIKGKADDDLDAVSKKASPSQDDAPPAEDGGDSGTEPAADEPPSGG